MASSRPLTRGSLPPKMSATSISSLNNNVSSIDMHGSNNDNNSSNSSDSLTYLSALTICCFSTSIDPLH